LSQNDMNDIQLVVKVYGLNCIKVETLSLSV